MNDYSLICVNCVRTYGQHYGEFCTRRDAELYRKTGKRPPFTFDVDHTSLPAEKCNPNTIFKRRKKIKNEI